MNEPKLFGDEVGSHQFREWQRSQRRLPETPRPAPSHASAPDTTERQAARKAAPKAGTWRGIILELIASSPEGLTDFEIHERLGRAINTVTPRRGELARDGWVKDSGRRRLVNGSPSIVWEAI